MPHNITSRNIHGGTFNNIGRDQTNNTYRGQVVGHHVQIESMTVGCSHAGQALVKRTMYDEFHQVLLGDVIALQNVHHEDLSEYEWQFRGRKILGRLRARATTQTVQLFPHGGTQFTVIKYDGADAEKAWKRDFETFSETRVPSHFPSRPHILTLPSDTENTPIASMQVENLCSLLGELSWTFDDLVKKHYDSFPDGMQGLAEGVDLSRRLRGRSSPKEWDQVLQQFLHLLHVWGCEIDSEAGKKDFRKWVRVKDSGSIQELDDDNEDFINNTPSSSTTPNSRTRSTQKDTRTSVRHAHSNTVQATRPQTTTSGMKPTKFRQLPKPQAQLKQPSPATPTKQVPSRRSDGGATWNAVQSRPPVQTGTSGVGMTRRVASDATAMTTSKAQPTKVTGAQPAGVSKPWWK
ncbi:hypothetical protein VNI00_017895 [Paramarasmius palmivorus]|uniref:Uncharacterized protein n=1 Tax=Paramarasmius palmivorus TaxID=297713 RepID=A0AAW0B1V1_9AGAR